MVFENIFNTTITGEQTDIISSIISYWPSAPISGLILLVIYMVMNPLKIEKWHANIAKLFSFFSKRAERQSVSADIQSRISSYVKNYKIEDVLPYGLRFKWIDGGNFESYVEKNDVVIIMDYHQNNARNFVNAILSYTAQGLLPHVRNFLPKEILLGTEILVQENIIRKERPDALNIFNTEIIPQRMSEVGGTKKIKEQLAQLHDFGYFENIYLTELAHVGPRLQEKNENIRKNEIYGFIHFLLNIVNRTKGDETGPLNLNLEIFHVWLVLIAKFEKITHEGTEPYMKRVKEAISKGHDSIYLMTRGKNQKHILPIIDRVKKETSAIFKWKRSFKSKDSDGHKTMAHVALFRI